MRTNNNDLAVVDDQLMLAMQLAEEMGISLDDEPSLSNSKEFTRYSLPDGVRFCVTYFDSGSFEWNGEGAEPDMKESFYKKAGEELIQMSGFNQIGGNIVHFELQPRLSTYDDEEKKSKVTCSVSGFVTKDLDTGNAVVIKSLPSSPLKSMYKWENNNINYKSPDPLVDSLGLVGSRGEACSSCIKNGNSTMEVLTKGGGSRIESCSTRGVLYIVVSELSKVTKKVSKVSGQEPEEVVTTYKVTDLCDEEGNPMKPFLLALNVTALGIRGAWLNEPKIIGYYNYIGGLERQFKSKDVRRSPKFHFTTITLRKKTDGIKYQLDFASHTPDLADVKSSLSLWNEVNPNKNPIIESADSYYSGRGNSREEAIEVESEFSF